MWLSRVVFPEPRKPVRTVTGMRVLDMGDGFEKDSPRLRGGREKDILWGIYVSRSL
jgi:hypothetical protein